MHETLRKQYLNLRRNVFTTPINTDPKVGDLLKLMMHRMSYPRWPINLCVYSIKVGYMAAELMKLEDLEDQRLMGSQGKLGTL